MKKEMALRISLKERVKLYVVNTLDPIAKTLSNCLEENISVGKLLRIFHAVLAFTFLVFTTGNAWLSVLFLVWFALTLADCRRAGIK